MNIDQNTLITLAIIGSLTLMGLVYSIRNTSTTLKVNFGAEKSFILEGKEAIIMPTNNKIDCLPAQENSQDCNH